jgi:DNA-directed RNA polymerase subunit RPC12/RpoP
MTGPEKYICTNCGFELDITDVKDAVAIEAEAAPMVGLSEDPLGVERPEPDPTTPTKYNITKCPNCGNDEWNPKE